MEWARKSNRGLVKAIVAAFSDSFYESRRKLASFTHRDWVQTQPWLDTSGLALYFLAHLQMNASENLIDGHVLARLKQKYENNRVRAANMLQELISLNHAFCDARVCYANVKGLTLIPHACPDPALRHQSDFDFLVDPVDLPRCRSILEERDYVVTGSTPRTLEFKPLNAQQSSLGGQYTAQQPRAIELHIAIDGFEQDAFRARDERLNRIVNWQCGKEELPTLSPVDQFVGQALHLLSHFRNEHTRPSWLLEYRHHAIERHNDVLFWRDVREAAEANREVAIAIGLSTVLAKQLFGAFSVPELDSWIPDTLPPRVLDWSLQYGQRAVLADVPGTKLFLLLDSALAEDVNTNYRLTAARCLLPRRLPTRVIPLPANTTLWRRIQQEYFHLRIILFRLRFHLREGIAYVLEARRWRRRWPRTHAAHCASDKAHFVSALLEQLCPHMHARTDGA